MADKAPVLVLVPELVSVHIQLVPVALRVHIQLAWLFDYNASGNLVH